MRTSPPRIHTPTYVYTNMSTRALRYLRSMMLSQHASNKNAVGDVIYIPIAITQPFYIYIYVYAYAPFHLSCAPATAHTRWKRRYASESHIHIMQKQQFNTKTHTYTLL